MTNAKDLHSQIMDEAQYLRNLLSQLEGLEVQNERAQENTARSLKNAITALENAATSWADFNEHSL